MRVTAHKADTALKVFLSLFVILNSLFVISCNNTVEPILILPQQYASVSGSISLKGASPASAARSALPSVEGATYYITASGFDVSGNPKTVTTGVINTTTNTYTITGLDVSDAGINWTIEIGLKDASDNTLYSANKTLSLKTETPVYTWDFLLQPDFSSGNGILGISMTVPTTVQKITMSCTASGWTAASPTLTLASTSATIAASEIASGAYEVQFDFWSATSNGVLLYSDVQSINIASGMTTNSWVYNGSAGPITSTGTYVLTQDLINDFVQTTIYVGTTDYGTAAAGNNGSIFSPLQTISQATAIIQKINNSSGHYTILVTGTLGPQELPSGINSKAEHITIKGARGLSGGDPQDSLLGSGSNSVLTISTTVSVTINDLAITNGSGTSVSGNTYGGGIYIPNNTEVTLGSGVKVYSNGATNGGGVYTCGTLKLTGCEIYDNTASDAGGGVYVTGGNVCISGRALIGASGKTDYAKENASNHSNVANSSGGGIYAYNSGVYIGYTAPDVVDPGDCTGGVMYNYAKGTSNNTGYGGGVYCDNSTTFKMAKGNVSYNATVVAPSPTFRGNGGGIYIGNTGTNSFTMSGGTIHKNKSLYGGGVDCRCKKMVITGGTIGDSSPSVCAQESSCSNYARYYGGGINIEWNGTLEEVSINDSVIAYNYAEGDGGGLYLFAQYATVPFILGENTEIKNNYAKGNGGGVYVGNNTTFACTMTNNKVYSTGDGGAIYMNEPGQLITLNPTFKITGAGTSVTKGTDDISLCCDPGDMATITLNGTLSNHSSDKLIGITFHDYSALLEYCCTEDAVILGTDVSSQLSKFKLTNNTVSFTDDGKLKNLIKPDEIVSVDQLLAYDNYGLLEASTGDPLGSSFEDLNDYILIMRIGTQYYLTIEITATVNGTETDAAIKYVIFNNGVKGNLKNESSTFRNSRTSYVDFVEYNLYTDVSSTKWQLGVYESYPEAFLTSSCSYGNISYFLVSK